MITISSGAKCLYLRIFLCLQCKDQEKNSYIFIYVLYDTYHYVFPNDLINTIYKYQPTWLFTWTSSSILNLLIVLKSILE